MVSRMTSCIVPMFAYTSSSHFLLETPVTYDPACSYAGAPWTLSSTKAISLSCHCTVAFRLAHSAGGAADRKHAWSEEEQRRLCKACQAAAVHQHPAEAVRLLQSQQLGMCIEDERLAWQLLKVIISAKAIHNVTRLHAFSPIPRWRVLLNVVQPHVCKA